MPTIVPNLTVITLADATTGWSGTSGQLDVEVYKQAVNIGSDGAYTYQTGKNSLEGCTFTPATNINMTANYTTPHLYWTMRCDVFPFCELLNTGATNSGLMVRVTDGAGNYTQWHVAGSDTWDGSWRNFVLDLTNTANVHSSSGTLSLADVDIITWYTDNSNSGNIRIIDNTWLDAVRYGDGLTAHSTTTENIDFQDIADDDALTANYYGVLQETDGVLFCQGGINIGLDANTTNFVSSGETLYFRDRIVDAGHYGINYVSGGANVTSISFDALVCKTVGLSGAELNLPADVGAPPSITNSTFINMGLSTLYYATVSGTRFVGCGNFSTTSCDFDACVFDACGIHLEAGASSTYDNCTFDGATGVNALTVPVFTGLTNNTFISSGTGHAVELNSTVIQTDMSVNWNNFSSGYAATDGSTGNETIHVNLPNVTNLTINVGAGYQTPTIRVTGTTVVTVVVNPVTTLITVKNRAGDRIVGARVYAITTGGGPIADDTVIFNTLTDSNGQVSDTRALGAPQTITGWARKSTAPSPYYKSGPFTEIISNVTGLTLNIALVLDE